MSFAATYKKIDEHAYIMQLSENANEGKRGAADSDDESVCVELNNLHMADIAYKYESSIYSSSSDGSQSNRLTPVPDDANSEFQCMEFKIEHFSTSIVYLRALLILSFLIVSFPNGSNRLVGAWIQRKNQARLFDTRD